MVIEAAPGKVWEMLTNSKYVAQWDELPEHDPEESMTGGGSKVVWRHSNGGQTITTFNKAEKNKE